MKHNARKFAFLFILSMVVLSFPVNAQPIWVNGYYTDWGVCGLTPAQIDWNAYTHLIHYTIEPSTLPNDPSGWANPASPDSFGRTGGAFWHASGNNLQILENGATTGCNYPVQRQLIDSAHAHGRKVMLGLGGVNTSGAWVWMHNNNRMRYYVRSVSDYCKVRGYDGVDIDWEQPPNSLTADLPAFYDLIRQLHDTMQTWSRRGELAIAAWNNVDRCSNWNMDTVQKYVDQINVMNYDQVWGVNVHTGLDGALYAYTCDATSQFWNNDNLLRRWVARGVNKKKLGMGLPYYAYDWQGGASDLCQTGTATGGNQSSFDYVYGLYRNNPERYHWNDQAKCPYLGYTDGTGRGRFISFQDTLSMFYKTRYTIDSGYGGLMIWELWRGINGADKNYLARGIKKAFRDSVIVIIRDSLNPTISINHPVNGDTVRGTDTVIVTAGDDRGVSKVEYLVNNNLVGTVYTSPFTYYWNTAGLTGSQVLTARAYDGAGNTGTSNQVTVTADNEPSSTVNVALMKPAYASSIQSAQFPPSAAVDTIPTNRWSSQYSDPQWICVNMNAVHKIDSISLRWELAYGTAYQIQTSLDSLTWTSGYSTTSGDGGYDNIKITPIDARYVRMYGTQRGTPWGYSLYSFEVYMAGKGAQSPPPTPGLLLPEDGSICQAASTALSWNAATGAARYHVQVGTDSLFNNLTVDDSTLAATSLHVSGLDNNRTYFWRVIAINEVGKSQWSPIRNFIALNAAISTTCNVGSNWNLVSVPLTVFNYSKNALYPSSISSAFAYQGSYVAANTLMNRAGYWLKFPGRSTLSMTGLPILCDTFSLNAGWNIIGSISAPVPVGTIQSDPPRLIVSDFYSYTGSGYVTMNTLQPMLGYWINVAQNAKLILCPSLSRLNAADQIRIVPTSEMPPPPPGSGTGIKGEVPAEFALFQNYPNPFNPSTTIHFALPQGTFVNLSVYNLLGEEISLLVNEYREAGEYSVQWNALGSPSGIYVYRIRSGDHVETRQMVLVK